MKYILYIIIAVALLTLSSCNGLNAKRAERETISISIAPLKSVVEAVAGDDFDIYVLVPAGSSPETYSPTPKQFTTVNNSVMLVYLGTLGFENEIVKRLSPPSLHAVDLSASAEIELLAECTDEDHEAAVYAHGHSHAGVDPHIWLSVKNLQYMANNLAQTLTSMYPDSTKYADNARKFIDSLQLRDAEYEQKLRQDPPLEFLIYHPALSYLARDYALEQLSVEEEGKDPTPTSVAAVIDHARRENIGYIMYQKEFAQSAVQSIVESTGIKSIEINPLSEDIIGELDRVVNIIYTGGNAE